MKNEVLTYGFIIYAVIMTVAVVYLCLQDRELKIVYPAVETSKIVYNPIFYIIEMPRHLVDVVSVYFDKENDEHQIYSDSLVIDSDSLSLFLRPTIDVNIEKKVASWDWGKLKIKTFEKVITNYIEVPKYIYETKDVPYYANEYFWLLVLENLGILAITILFIIGAL